MSWGRAIVAVAAMLVLMCPNRSRASGVHSAIALFESNPHPDLPLDAFAAGRLGLIKPTWFDSYRYLAYRYLVGPGFNPAEQKALLSMWNQKLAGATPLRDAEQASSEWLAARNQVPGVEAIDRMELYRSAVTTVPPGVFKSAFYYANCNASSLRTATATLEAMSAKFGASSPEVKRWVDAQDQVFDNCSDRSSLHYVVQVEDPSSWFKAVNRWNQARKVVPGVSSPPSFSNRCKGENFTNAAMTLDQIVRTSGASSPQAKQWVQDQDRALEECSRQPAFSTAPTPAPTPTLDIPAPLTDGTAFEQAQRTYQIACANFYCGRFDKAAQMFAAIGADSSSPWREWGLYLAARATVRKATLNGTTNDPAILAQAETQLKAIVAAPGSDEVRLATQRLLSFVEFRLHPEQRVAEVSGAIIKSDSEQTLAQDVSDYVGMFGYSTRNPDGFYVDDLADWLSIFNQSGGGEIDHTIAQWKRSGSIPWLIAALAMVPGSDANVPAVLAAAEKVKPDSPAYATVTFHSARLLLEQNKIDQARSKLDALLAMRRVLPRSTVNQASALRMRAARNLDELLTYAQRFPLGVTDDGDGAEIPRDINDPRLAEIANGPLFDRDAAELISSKLALSVQKRAAQSRILPDNLRADVALAAFTRALLLNDDASERELAPIVGRLVPSLKPPLDAWRAANSPEERRFDVAFIMLTHPGMRPYVNPGIGRVTALDEMDGLRDNWWQFPPQYAGAQVRRWPPPPPPDYPLFVSTAEKKAAEEEWKKLSTIYAPDLMCAEAIRKARLSPDDEHVPEALYRCINAVHLAVSSGDRTNDLAKTAYALLHRRYPDTTWAKQNRFWYKANSALGITE